MFFLGYPEISIFDSKGIFLFFQSREILNFVKDFFVQSVLFCLYQYFNVFPNPFLEEQTIEPANPFKNIGLDIYSSGKQGYSLNLLPGSGYNGRQNKDGKSIFKFQKSFSECSILLICQVLSFLVSIASLQKSH
ncbi:UNKNOWN [Stylonychia lemnae]|uniref:Uncharacterized protein n=1 Tax=Stylonychia lemnae TaxID=5949 RepID=A0A078ANP8_STYLE|nr:UNKNOWN [Stylonychia lemnae]|eukprot:CDW83789.1 UNKNOWN [Stylonychia lemnae]